MDPYSQFASPAVMKQPDGPDPYSAFASPRQKTPDEMIDYARPAEAVRADVGKLTPEFREKALTRWADHFVAKENENAGIGSAIDNTARTMARGTFAGPWLDEATAIGNKALQVATGGIAGGDYDETLAYQRAKDRALDKDAPVLSMAGKIAGGIAGGVGSMITQGPGVMLNAARIAAGGPLGSITPAATVPGRVAQSAGVGGVYGANAGAGDGEGGALNRAEGAAQGAGIGMAIGGALAPIAEGVNAVRGAMARQGQNGAAVQMAEKLPGTVDDFANEVAVGATRSNQGIQRRTLDILGEEMERAGGDRVAAQAATIARIQREVGVNAQTAQTHVRNLTRVHENSPLMLGEYPSVSASNVAQRQRQPGNVDLDELGRTQDSQTQGLIDYLANSGNSRSAVQVRNAVNQRQEALAPHMADTLDRIGPRVTPNGGSPRAATIQDTADMVEHATQVGGAAYRAAYAAPVNNHLMLNTLPRLLAAHETRAATRSGEAAEAIRRAVGQFYLTPQPGQRLAMGTLRQLQDARTAVRGQMEAYASAGRRDLAGTVRPFYQQMTAMMERMSPEWGVANRAWRDMNFEVQAQELGDAFAKRAGPQFREQIAEFNTMAPQAQNIVRTHFLQQLRDKLDNLGDTHGVSKLFANDHSRNMIRQLFGDAAAIDFTRAIRDQKVAEMSKAGLANSRTHIRGQVQREMDADTGILASANNASVQGVRGWMMERLTQLLTEQRNRPLAGIVTTPMNDTAAVAQRITQMRNAQQRAARAGQPNLMAPIASGTLSGMAGDSTPRRRGMLSAPPR